jgi:hypothetical protein
MVLLAAGLSLMVSASWMSDPLWLVTLAACLPGAVSLLLRYLDTFRMNPDILLLHPEKNWKVGTFSDIAAQTSVIKAQSIQQQMEQMEQSVQLTQRWQHFLGLTLRLKIQNPPHNMSEYVRLTIWRCTVPVDVYRRLCVLTAWRIDQPQKVPNLETV